MTLVTPMKHFLVILAVLQASLGLLRAQVPNLVSYQGRVAVGTVNFHGTGQFKFALVDATGATSYWSNDGTSTAGSQPAAAVSLNVTRGLYSVLLGDTALAGMTVIPASAWANADVRLRVWFNDGTNGFQLLTPDQRMAPGGYLPDGAVTTAKIANQAVGASQIAGGAITGPKIADGSINSSKLTNGAVQNTNLAAGAVNTAQIADSAVTSAKINNGAVDSTKIANNAVGTAQIASNAVNTAHIAADAVGTAQIAAIAVTGPKIADDAVTGAKISNGAVGSLKIADEAVTSVKIANFAVTTTQIAANAVTSPKIADDAVGPAKIANGAVGSLKIADGAVTLAKLGADVGPWAVSGGNVYRSSGSVGIGTSTPGTALQVVGTISTNTLTSSTINTTSGIINGDLWVGEDQARIRAIDLDLSIGDGADNPSDTGGGNVSFGHNALLALYSSASTFGSNVAIGYSALGSTRGSRNIALGYGAGTTLQNGSDNIYIGNDGNDGLNTGLINESGAIRLGTPGTHTKTLLAGRVGIGTTSPAVPLDVVGFNNISQTATYFTLNSTGFTTGPTVISTSIRASSEIQATYFAAVSDARIKNVQGRSDNAADLQTLRGIEVTDYFYKDVAEKGGRPVKKVIAQQVEKVFPQAVSQSTNVVPDIFKKAPIHEGWVKLATDLKPGDRVRLLTEQGHRAEHEVLEVGKDEFRTDFTGEAGQVFVYGREVKDFRAVDYEAIAMLNVSATQELARLLEKKEAEIAALKKQLTDNAARDQALEARLAALEQRTPVATARAAKVAMTK